MPTSNWLTGANNYTVTFPAGGLPPVQLFWSITLYGLPDRLLVANPIDRYSIGDRTEGLRLRRRRVADPVFPARRAIDAGCASELAANPDRRLDRDIPALRP